jgi:hypothetical protein
MILFNDIIEILDLADLDTSLMILVVTFDRCRIGAALVDRDLLCYWLRVSDIAGPASATDQAKTQELPGRGDDFESEPGILSFGGRTELRRDLRRHNSTPNAWFTLTEVA